MNILITGPSLDVKKNVSGISSVVNSIIKYNKAANYYHFLSGKEDDEAGGLKRLTPLFKSYLLFYSLSKKNKYDILHLNLALNPKSILRDYSFFEIASFFKKKTITHLHGGKHLTTKPKNLILKYIINRIIKNSDILIVLSDLEKDLVQQYSSRQDTVSLSNSVEDTYLEANIKDKSEIVTRFLFLGRLHESKGLDYLIKAFEELCSSGINAVLNICGTGPLEERVTEATNRNHKIIFHGIVSGADKLDKLTSNDVFVLPSIHGEGLPVALLECMAVGLVPITTSDGSMGSVVSNGTNGLLVPKHDSTAIYGQMKLLCKKTDLISQMSKESKSYISQNFRMDNYVKKLNEIYNDVLNT
ncbi:glycosyltransferase family 4 protein [Mucilaginibacter calamicampi]|uniref:Glycosyltransferase family 4 protein n=1 Tax=Mucilaginibacter calamicampi TaxID=1302352 RepID=A0ABW2YWD9_9SPHI